MTIGEKIQTLRLEAGLSQMQLADEIGVSRQTVSKWESDAALPDTDKVLLLARCFGVTTDALLQSETPLPETGKTAEAQDVPFAAADETADFWAAQKRDGTIAPGGKEAEDAEPDPADPQTKKQKTPRRRTGRRKGLLIGALVAALVLLTVGAVLALAGGGALGKLIGLKPKAKNLQSVTVLIHGLGGWGEDAPTNAYSHYWGGDATDLPAALRAEGCAVIAPSVGPISSTWDRACELYAKLTGTRVDYGAAHAAAHNHARFGRDYTDAGPMLPGWGETATAALVGHSFGGETARLLAWLLANGDEAERSTEQADRSPLFDGGHTHWVYSVTTLCSPQNGSSLTEVIDRAGGLANGLLGGILGQLTGVDSATDLVAQLAYAMAGLSNPANGTYDFMLDQFGITDATGGFSDVIAAFSAAAGSGQDHAGYELTPDGAAALNARIGTVPEVLYFSYAYCCTTASGSVHVPTAETLGVLYPAALAMGSVTATTPGGIVIGADWFPNDGLVNVISALYPAGQDFRSVTAEEEADEATRYQPGIWNVFPVRAGHHGSVLGMGRTQEETLTFYRALLRRINTGK